MLADETLERELRLLGEELDYPPMPALAERVRLELTRPVADAARRARRWSRQRRLIALVAAAALLVAGTAVAIRFLVPGVEIRRMPAPPTGSPPPADHTLDLGRRTSLLGAADEAGFAIIAPQALGTPDEVWIDQRFGVTRVSLVYLPRPGLPESATTGVGALLTEFRARVEAPTVVKEVGPGSTVETLDVGGQPAYWIEGDPHAVLYVAPDGTPFPDELRLAGNVLLWQRGEITLRLEGELTRGRALAIARSGT